MKVLYLCSFPVTETDGKSRATFQKLEALRTQVNDLRVVSIPEGLSKVGKLFRIFVAEIDALACILSRNDRPRVFVSRGFSGWISIPIAKKLDILTVREVHADALGEVKHLPFGGLAKFVVTHLTKLAVKIDRNADVRVFNHPALLEWHSSRYGKNKDDFFVYNGGASYSASKLSREQARSKFGFKSSTKYLVFVGAASKWHGVEQLVSLQEEFIRCGDDVAIVCAGGAISNAVDPNKVLINYSPVDSAGCADFIRAADACLLTVADNRVSPGSPLKLYDYLIGGRPVITQQDVIGYADEVERYGSGIAVDFTSPISARSAIVEFINSPKLMRCEASILAHFEDFTWEARMKQWKVGFESARSRLD